MSAAVCLGRLAGSGVSEPRTEVFPQLTDVFKPNQPLKTQPCHLRHAAVSFPLTSSGSEMSLLFQLRRRKSHFLKHFPSNLYFVVGIN